MDADTLRMRAARSEQAARDAVGRLSDGKLATTWLLTEALPITDELAVTRGWLMDELEKRMDPDDFDAWLFSDAELNDPRPYLGR
jgi:hypothetical protein